MPCLDKLFIKYSINGVLFIFHKVLGVFFVKLFNLVPFPPHSITAWFIIINNYYLLA